MKTGIALQYNRIKEEEAQNKAKPQPLKLVQILREIDNEKLVIPEFQRDFGWELDKFVLLFDSIYRGYTIGNLLLWKVRKKLAHKPIGAQKIKTIDQIEDKEYTYVLDGQQRLTTLYAVLSGNPISKKGTKPKIYKIYFDINNDEFIKENEKLEDFGNRTIKRVILDGDFDEFRFIDMAQVFNEKLKFPENIIEKYEKENLRLLDTGEIISKEYVKLTNDLKDKKKIFEQFALVMKSFEIPQIVEYSDDIDKVVNVFERINTQNMRLDIFDIMVAKTYDQVKYLDKPHTFNLKRTAPKLLYKKDLKESQLSPKVKLDDDPNLYYGITNITLLRLLSIFINSDKGIFLQKKDIYNLKAQQIQNNIITFKKLLINIHGYCKNQLNIDDIDERYTNNNVLSFLSYVFSQKSYREIDDTQMNYWFWNSMIFDRFPGAQLQLIERDIRAFNEDYNSFKQNIKQKRSTNILNNSFSVNGKKLIDAGYQKVTARLYQSCILLLNSICPQDFDGKHQIELANYVGSNTKNNKHHIIPLNSTAGKNLRKKYGTKRGDFIINNIANIAIISSELNKEISNKIPKKYFDKYENTPEFFEILKTHLIDEVMYDKLMNEEYEDFLVLRTEKILELITEKCSIDNEKFLFETHNEDLEED